MSVDAPERPRPWWPGVGAAAAVVLVALLATAGRYGYHRDELYFLRAGRELAFGYVDQPPLTPLLARAATSLFGDSLVGLRVASAVAAALVVVCAGLLAREFGGGRGAQLLAAAGTGASSFLLAVGHLLSTTTFDVLAWTVATWLTVRALRDGGAFWVLVGVVVGIGLQNKVMPAFLVGALLIGILVAGPREVLRTPWPWLAGLVALAIWAPFLVWEARHGWPMLDLSSAIAGGGSGTSASRWILLPYQLVIVSPLLVPVWGTGLWRLARDPALRTWRAFAVVYVVLLAFFVATGGKPYYLVGLYPLLVAAGAGPVVAWAARGAARVRRSVLVAGVALAAAVSALLFLPLVPATALPGSPIVAVDYDAGEQIGWPAVAATIARAADTLPPAERATTVVLAENYGEAGAIDRYGPALGLPPVYSGHNSYAEWGPPPESATTAIVVGYRPEALGRWCGSVEPLARIDNGIGLDNDEQGAPVVACRDRTAPWAQLWPEIRRIG
ncbi:glycosyltransferase family 39 protein [Pseudonocardia sp. N23]|uniref:glycosyltransferase family 39 protein n=1 Tax=Pseudonocardia sp. N23 TaxID=1987376 RepID=UPI000BFCCCD8|nr:glycosyltransferase family 39 protein [Pseudonocardia sp. N23]